MVGPSIDTHTTTHTKGKTMKLLTLENPKTSKGRALGYETGILHLAPASESGYNVCGHSTAGCRAACLNKAGRAGIERRDGAPNSIQAARIRRTKLFFADRSAFAHALHSDIVAVVRRAKRAGLTPAVRLNGTSDLPWERIKGLYLFHRYPDVQFYDYTKVGDRVHDSRYQSIDNYRLTFSFSGHNWDTCKEWLEADHNVAVVFRGTLPATWRGWPVIDGDVSDCRIDDDRPAVVGLKAKGRAKADETGFVVDGGVV